MTEEYSMLLELDIDDPEIPDFMKTVIYRPSKDQTYVCLYMFEQEELIAYKSYYESTNEATEYTRYNGHPYVRVDEMLPFVKSPIKANYLKLCMDNARDKAEIQFCENEA